LVLSSPTRGLVGAAELERRKPKALLTNASRGPIVEGLASISVLKNKQIAGAAIDVKTSNYAKFMSDRQIGVQVEGFARTPIPARANPSPAPVMRYFVKRTILNRLIHRRIYFFLYR
jgi:lactate dehydrogenase-like 2-hydroxyacid dehydrogenase